jgi:hypothetical protein
MLETLDLMVIILTFKSLMYLSMEKLIERLIEKTVVKN